jgi:hypothetical protein
MKKDNTTLDRKASLRYSLLKKISLPVVLETHAGLGQIWKRVYAEIPQGIAFEEKAAKAERLAVQRPTWSVYESDCIKSLAAGVGAHLAVNLVDVDPYGEPWKVLQAFFGSERPRPARLGIVVNDGVRMKLKLTGGWDVETLRPAVEHFGNSTMYPEYLTVARWNLERLAAPLRYELTDWTGYYCGHGDCMTHYAAVLERAALPPPKEISDGNRPDSQQTTEARPRGRKKNQGTAAPPAAERKNSRPGKIGGSRRQDGGGRRRQVGK